MPGYEYKIVPAPDRAKKIRGVKGPEARFAATLEDSLNTLGAEGWEFVRTEVISVEERAGLTGKMSIELDDCLIYQQSTSVTQYNYAASGWG